ncbi:MAG: N-acetylmuramic acid 6-phosphate etherase [Ardenticatenaceae bacterium]|nr:N-acetylmuramic acid 6-phosphate etherase [Ardenticatenaceae bacterium]
MEPNPGLFVIGVDGGGSKTAVALLDNNGQVLGRGLSGSSNHHNVGLAQAKANLWAGMSEAAAQAEVALGTIAAATWSLAGVDRPEERELFGQMAASMLPGVPVRVENDAVGALVGGLGHHNGIVLIAGTGMIAYGENERGERARGGGWGPFFDHGSGYDLVQSTLRLISQQTDGNQNGSVVLVEQLVTAVGLNKVTDFLVWVYAPERRVADIAALAPVVLAAAERGDLAALLAVNQGAEWLATAVATVAHKLGHTEPFQLVLGGGILSKSSFYREVVVQAIQTRLPQAQPILPKADAAVGAGLMALELAGKDLRGFENLGGLAHAGDKVPGTAASATHQVWSSERANVLSRELDLLPTEQVVGLMHILDRTAVATLQPVLPVIARVVDEIAARLKENGRLIYVGAGTSGRLGILDAAECPPTFHTSPELVVGVIAGGETAVTRSIEGAEDEAEAGAAALHELGLCAQDCVVGLAASGRTPFVVGALRAARAAGALTAAVVCNVPSPVAEAAEYVIAPLVGPEILTGSTRLKAGTAQKLVLNMLSTAVMVRLGKTYGNLMVDVQATNNKLRARAGRIVATACGVDGETAESALQASEGEVKTAVVSLLLNVPPEEAKQRLATMDGNVRKAIAGV